MLPFDFWVVSKEKTQPRDAEQTTDSKEDKTEVVSSILIHKDHAD